MNSRSPRKGTFQTTTHIAVVVFLLILFVSVAYFFQIPVEDQDAQQADSLAELHASRELWEASRPPAFRYVVARNCDCDEPFKAPYVATEQSGEKSVDFAGSVMSRLGNEISGPPEPVWIDDLFEIADAALRSNDLVELRFDILSGYPKIVAIRNQQSPIRGELHYEIRDFEILVHRGE